METSPNTFHHCPLLPIVNKGRNVYKKTTSRTIFKRTNKQYSFLCNVNKYAKRRLKQTKISKILTKIRIDNFINMIFFYNHFRVRFI